MFSDPLNYLDFQELCLRSLLGINRIVCITTATTTTTTTLFVPYISLHDTKKILHEKNGKSTGCP